MASVLALAPMATGFPQVFAPAQPHPVTTHVHTVGFVKSSVAALRTARNATGSVARAPGAPDPVSTARAAAVTPVQDVAGPVTVVGVTWPRGAVSAHGQFQIRTLSGSTWSLWQPMKVIDGGRDGTAAVPAIAGTDPYVVTGASKYEVRSLTTDAAVPAAATVDAVDPGTSSADSAQPAPGAASAATAMPAIHTRAQWGANESAMTWPPSYGTISVGFVHHTDGSNNYTAAQVPAMIRAIYGYHAQTLHWGDIGYNFLVDRFGRIWEGRYGGMDKPVIGGHVYNYNAVSTGVSALGTFTSAAVPQPMTDAFKRILAWKLSVAGIPATGTSPVAAPSGAHIQRISGHRDVGGTTCPGDSLYAKLPEIRAGAAAIMSAAPPTPSHDPFGVVDAVNAGPLSVTAAGWAIDPDTSAPIIVQMYIDDRANAVTWANQSRTDVGAVYPSSGPNHGYHLTMATTPGTHTVCVYGINTGPGTSTKLGCRAVTVSSNPFGAIDAVNAGPQSVTAGGWAIDPDTSAPIIVQMYIDSRANAMTWANQSRTDVGAVYPASGPNHGYNLKMATTAGTHTVCLYGINTGPGTSVQFGCRAVTVH
ncbi:MAG TPA: N-acetylmuramoyl-L-alanine amidase [Dermatophilaceae bacterium]|nr:N-acetylmuramoyl-L-alanine amidase [Dermatophilaceae bacterium]